MGIIGIINNQGTAQAIAILVLEMTVVPERSLQDTNKSNDGDGTASENYYRLVQRLKVVHEVRVWNDRALGNKRRAINIVCVLLKKTMPVLWKGREYPVVQRKRDDYNGGRHVHGRVR
jgi:hypothetical protein